MATFGALADPRYPQRHAIETIAPGEVLVMDCRGVAAAAAAGDILVARLQARAAAGLVADGGIRDYRAVQNWAFRCTRWGRAPRPTWSGTSPSTRTWPSAAPRCW